MILIPLLVSDLQFFAKAVQSRYRAVLEMAYEAPLPQNLHDWTKSLSFRDSGLTGQPTFSCRKWNSL